MGFIHLDCLILALNATSLRCGDLSESEGLRPCSRAMRQPHSWPRTEVMIWPRVLRRPLKHTPQLPQFTGAKGCEW